MPGTWQMRWSMGVAPMNPVTRWRSMRSRILPALNRSSSTIRLPAIRFRAAVNPLVWYSGAGTRTSWGMGSSP